MKLKNLFLKAAIALGAMACSNNNEPGIEPVVLNGTYDGLVSMSVMGKNMGNSFVSFKVTSVSDGSSETYSTRTWQWTNDHKFFRYRGCFGGERRKHV